MATTQSRRRFLTTLSLAGAAGLTGAPHVLVAAEAPETTTVRLVNDGSICIAPLFAAEELLRAEGFADIRFVPHTGGPASQSGGGRQTRFRTLSSRSHIFDRHRRCDCRAGRPPCRLHRIVR